MTVPTFVAASPTQAVSEGLSLTVALPGSLVPNDLLLLCLATANQALELADMSGGTWTAVAASPQGVGTPGTLDATRVTVYWSRYNGTQGNPRLGAAGWDQVGVVWDMAGWDPGDVSVGMILAFRRCTPTGDPWDTAAGGTQATATTVLTIPGGTTTGADRLVVSIVADSIDSNGARLYPGVVSSPLVNPQKVWDAGTTVGSNVGLVAIAGDKGPAGAYGATTASYVLATTQAWLSLALLPAVAAAPRSPLEKRYANVPGSLAARVARSTW